MQFAFFKGSECQQTPAGPCGHLSVFFPPQSNRFRSRDGTAVVFQKMFMPFGHHPVIPDGLCYKLTHLEKLPWIHFIWVILCYKTLSIEKCVGMKKLKGDSNDFSGKWEAWLSSNRADFCARCLKSYFSHNLVSSPLKRSWEALLVGSLKSISSL